MKTVLNLKIDRETKQQAAGVAESMGLTLSAIVNSFLHNYVQTRELHLTANPRMTPYLEQVVKKARIDFKANKNISKPLETAEAIEKHFSKFMQ